MQTLQLNAVNYILHIFFIMHSTLLHTLYFVPY